VGFGRSLDAQQHHELSLRLQHFSNADIKRPNPGENFVQLRYAVAF
jgi:lipid A 3-O-deacylase